MDNAISIDLEDWFCVKNLEGIVPFERWDSCELRVEESTRKILTRLDAHGVKATFFVLGWIAERVPHLIREIAESGHEIGLHSYAHRPITDQTPRDFERDLRRSLDAVRNIVDVEIAGFRAPSFTVTRETMWVVEVLRRNGLRYDSSIFPIGVHPDYGVEDAPLEIFEHPGGLLEFPMSVAEIFGTRIPCSGGGYFRLMPYAVTRWLLERVNAAGRPFVFYLHPWELDPEQPRMPMSPTRRFRHYTGLRRTEARLDALLSDFSFSTVRDVMQRWTTHSTPTPTVLAPTMLQPALAPTT